MSAQSLPHRMCFIPVVIIIIIIVVKFLHDRVTHRYPPHSSSSPSHLLCSDHTGLLAVPQTPQAHSLLRALHLPSVWTAAPSFPAVAPSVRLTSFVFFRTHYDLTYHLFTSLVYYPSACPTELLALHSGDVCLLCWGCFSALLTAVLSVLSMVPGTQKRHHRFVE